MHRCGHTYSHEPKTCLHVKARVTAQGRGRSLVNVLTIKNTNMFGEKVSRAYAAKAEVHLGHADRPRNSKVERYARWFVDYDYCGAAPQHGLCEKLMTPYT